MKFGQVRSAWTLYWQIIRIKNSTSHLWDNKKKFELCVLVIFLDNSAWFMQSFCLKRMGVLCSKPIPRKRGRIDVFSANLLINVPQNWRAWRKFNVFWKKKVSVATTSINVTNIYIDLKVVGSRRLRPHDNVPLGMIVGFHAGSRWYYVLGVRWEKPTAVHNTGDIAQWRNSTLSLAWSASRGRVSI